MKKAPYSSKALFFFERMQAGLPVSEIHLIQPDRIVLHVPVAILLIIHGEPVPAGGAGIFQVVNVMSNPIQRDRLEK